MRRTLAALVLFCAIAAPVSDAGASEPFYGLWRTPVDGGGLVRLEACGERVCGFVVDSPRLQAHPDQRDVRNSDPALRGRRLDGLKIVEARPLGPDRLGDGWVYNPEDGNTYAGSIVLLPDGRLRLTGCVVWPLCRTQIWRRDDLNPG